MSSLYLAFWNLENLFDVDGSPRRPSWLQRRLAGELDGWNDGLLAGKIANLARVIGMMNDGNGPDLIGVCEVENSYVLELLVDALAPLNRDYGVVFEEGQDQRGIDTALLFDRDRVQFERHFSHFIMRRNATRDILQGNFKTREGNHDLVLIANHWPSRSGGALASAPYRMLAGETLAYFHQRILEEKGRNVAIVAMGDFNDEPFDRSVTDYALAYRDRAKVLNARNPVFLNLAWEELGRRRGSYYYSSFTNMLDQIWVSRGMVLADASLKPDASGARIEDFDIMRRDGPYPGPIRYGRPSRTLDPDGFSDHFPVSVRVAIA